MLRVLPVVKRAKARAGERAARALDRSARSVFSQYRNLRHCQGLPRFAIIHSQTISAFGRNYSASRDSKSSARLLKPLKATSPSKPWRSGLLYQKAVNGLAAANSVRHESEKHLEVTIRCLICGVNVSPDLAGLARGDATCPRCHKDLNPWRYNNPISPPPIGFLGQFFSGLRERRYQEWLAGEEGRKYQAYNQLLDTARNEYRRAQQIAQKVLEEEQRRLLAEQSKTRDGIDSLKPKEFEQYVANVFAALGYTARLTPASNDEGIDAYLDKDGRRAIVQCKHYPKGKVSRPAVQQVFGVLRHKKVAEAFIVTTGSFSRQAVEFAEGKPVHLIDGTMLVAMAQGAFTEEFIRSGSTGAVKFPKRRRRYYW